MMRTLLLRGLIAGLLAGLAAAAFALIVGEPQVDAAIAIEEANAAGAHSHGEDVHSHADAAPGHDHGQSAADTAAGEAEEELVPRDVQKFVGMPIATVAYGAAIGGLFALAFAFVYGRFGAGSARLYAGVLAACAFVAVSVVPFVKYPANPPAVGRPGTIGDRTELFFGLLGISVIAAGIAAYAAIGLAERLGRWNAGLLALAGYLVVIIGVGLLLPAVDEVPADFPPTVLWDFRLASIGGLAVLWAVLGVSFGLLVQRALAAREAPATPDAAVV